MQHLPDFNHLLHEPIERLDIDEVVVARGLESIFDLGARHDTDVEKPCELQLRRRTGAFDNVMGDGLDCVDELVAGPGGVRRAVMSSLYLAKYRTAAMQG